MQNIMELGNWEESGDRQKEVWRVSGESGKGFLEKTLIRPGLSLIVHEREFFRESSAKLEANENSIGFYCCLAGFEKLKIGGCKTNTVFTQGQSGIFIKGKGLTGMTAFSNNHFYRIFSIEIDKKYFNGSASEELKDSLKVFKKISNGDVPDYYSKAMLTTPRIMDIIYQITNYSCSGSVKQIFLEGKALEFIAYMVDDLACNKSRELISFSNLKPLDIEKIYFARDLLFKNLADPPGLFELAKTAGMNHFKLNRGFKEVFGETVFSHLRSLRLKEAKRLLIEGKMNVTEVSFCVGYSCLSHFAKIFKEEYGASPGFYLKRHFSVSSISAEI